MIHEENKNQQPEIENFSIENFLTDEKKNLNRSRTPYRIVMTLLPSKQAKNL